jgi:hypothetical protein
MLPIVSSYPQLHVPMSKKFLLQDILVYIVFLLSEPQINLS